MFPDLRQQSAEFYPDSIFPVMGLRAQRRRAKATMYSVLEQTVPHLPTGKPRYLMGVGSPEDLLECAARGVDMFDCVLPTRIARNGALFTENGRINIRNAQYLDDSAPIEEGCTCYTCSHFSRAYLRHLIKSDEVLGLRLTTIHNLHFLLELAKRIRNAITNGSFQELLERFRANYKTVDETVRSANREARAAAFEARRGR